MDTISQFVQWYADNWVWLTFSGLGEMILFPFFIVLYCIAVGGTVAVCWTVNKLSGGRWLSE